MGAEDEGSAALKRMGAERGGWPMSGGDKAEVERERSEARREEAETVRVHAEEQRVVSEEVRAAAEGARTAAGCAGNFGAGASGWVRVTAMGKGGAGGVDRAGAARVVTRHVRFRAKDRQPRRSVTSPSAEILGANG
jgi:hypothetical protein